VNGKQCYWRCLYRYSIEGIDFNKSRAGEVLEIIAVSLRIALYLGKREVGRVQRNRRRKQVSRGRAINSIFAEATHG
jgi:hypothetical protein